MIYLVASDREPTSSGRRGADREVPGFLVQQHGEGGRGGTLSCGGTALRLPPPQSLSPGCVPAPLEWGPGAWAQLVAGTFHTEAPGTHLPCSQGLGRCPQGRHDASGGPAVGPSCAEGGACGDVWGSVTQQLRGGEGSSGQWWGVPRALTGVTEAGSRPQRRTSGPSQSCTPVGGGGPGSLRQDLQDQPPLSASRAASRPHRCP